MPLQTALGLALKSFYSEKTRKQRGERERDSHIDSFWSNMASRGEVRKMMSMRYLTLCLWELLKATTTYVMEI